MASRYLNNGTWSFTLSTRTLVATLVPSGFVAADATYHRTVLFVNTADDAVYWGTIESYTNTTTVVLNSAGSLPTANKTGVTGCIIVYDFGTQRTYGNYISAIDSFVKDESAKLTSADKIQSLNNALIDYNKDKPYVIAKAVTQNGTSEYLLSTIFGALWANELSSIKTIELPTAGIPPSYLDNADYQVYDDGTAQDGSNLKLKFAYSVSQDFIVKFSTERKIPQDTVPNFPDTNETFNNIVLLGAMYQCIMLASVFAQSVDSTISADAVAYNEKTNKYITLAKEYYKRYCQNVFGSDEPVNTVKSASVSHSIDVQSLMNTPNLFHSKKGSV